MTTTSKPVRRETFSNVRERGKLRPVPERRARVLREELKNQPTFAGFCGPMWDGDAIRYEDTSSYERLSA